MQRVCLANALFLEYLPHFGGSCPGMEWRAAGISIAQGSACSSAVLRLPPRTDPKGRELGEVGRHCKKAEAEWNSMGSVKVQHSESQTADNSILHCIPSSAVPTLLCSISFISRLVSAAWVWSCLSCWALWESRNHTIHVKPTSAPSVQFPSYFWRGGKDAPPASFGVTPLQWQCWTRCLWVEQQSACTDTEGTNLKTSFGQ